MQRFLLALLFVVASCRTVIYHPETLTKKVDTRAYNTPTTIIVMCNDGGGQMGTGIVAAPNKVITAKHVVTCGGEGRSVASVVVLKGKERYDATIEKTSENFDVALLDVQKSDFVYYAPFTKRVPTQGEQVCTITNQKVKKCGLVVDSDENSMVFNIHGVHGNSGSPVFNEQGEVVGVLIRATMDYSIDELTMSVNTSAFSELLPKSS